VEVPAPVKQLVAAYLHEVDAAVPGLLEGLYLTGSLALGDFQPDISDIDAVAVCADRPNPAQLDALAAVHVPTRPDVDVLYLTREDLSTNPAQVSAPHSHEGAFHRTGAFAANPVEWRTLQTRAITIRGRPIEAGEVWFDADVLRRWNADNLNSYWRNRVDWMRGAKWTEALTRWEYGLQWVVLGVPRLHQTINTLQITSKTGAGLYALELADERWHRVIETAVALRADRAAPLPAPPNQLRRDAVELVTWLIDDATELIPT